MDEAGRKVNIRRECIGDCDLTEKEYCRKPSGKGRIANLKRAGYDVAWSVLSTGTRRMASTKIPLPRKCL